MLAQVFLDREGLLYFIGAVLLVQSAQNPFKIRSKSAQNPLKNDIMRC